MSAYSIDLVTERCATCGKLAKVEVRNSRNARIGAFCRRCGDRRLKGLLREEEAAPGSFREESLRRPLES